jgi:ankyrin repeat protein
VCRPTRFFENGVPAHAVFRKLCQRDFQKNRSKLTGAILGRRWQPERARGGWQPEHHDIAAQQGHTEAVKLLLAAKASVDAANKDGWTPLYIAARKGHTEAIKLLLAANADPTKEVQGWTALAIADRNGHKDIAALLRK